MLYKRFGKPDAPVIILLHGGGLSWWSLKDVVALLEYEYQIVTPVIDGCGEAADTPFVSIEASAADLLEYIETNCNGRVLALGGLSLGAQIAVEAMSVNPDAAEFAIIESALVCPIRGTKTFSDAATRMSYGLIKRRWFSRLQAKELCVPEALFEQYYEESIRITKQSLINTIRSNGTYKLKDGIRKSRAKALIIVGEKERAIMKKSAHLLRNNLQNSKLYVAPHLKHGELSLKHPEKYVELIQSLLKESKD